MSEEIRLDSAAALSRVEQALAEGKLSEGAAEHLRQWLTEPRYQAYVPQILQHIEQQQWQQLDDVFWTIIPFGTGGRRGRMYPIGCNAINDRTIGESAQGLADYVKSKHQGDAELSCAIAYDTRHRSRHFAELCAGIMVAAGFKVYFLDDYRSTPELSFLVRHKQCACGIMVTASHNPPSDNAVKVYWSTGGQVLPPHDQAIIEHVMNTEEIHHVPFSEAFDKGRVVLCRDEVDRAYFQEVVAQAMEGPRDVRVLYSPLHGVGAFSVCPVLKQDGFKDVEVYGPHAEPDGDFPHVPNNVSNPENPAVFDVLIEQGQKISADLVLATDPDCDRMGCAAPVTRDAKGPWKTFTGNQLGSLLTDFVLQRRRETGRLTPDHYVVKTLVTTEMIRRIADSYGVKTYSDLHVGFKWIGGQMDEAGPEGFVLGTEESHGYLVGSYARDKDGAVACMLMAELAAQLKSEGQTLHEKLDALFWQHGYHAERTVSIFMEGSEGMARMKALMSRFREKPPESLAGIPIVATLDYLHQTRRRTDGQTEPLEAPRGDLVILDLAEEGNYVAVRPSGTEPKVKFYMFTFVPAEQLADLEATKEEMAGRLTSFENDLREFAQQV